MNKLIKMGCILALLVSSFQVQAFRCGNKLVLRGDPVYEVYDKCGKPDVYMSMVDRDGNRRTILVYKRYGHSYTVHLYNTSVTKIVFNRR